MKITLYTVATCKFSAEEKTYLQSHNLPFEEKDVEKDHAALEEMLKVGNNFAGTPVTHVTKDDGQEVVLKGFTAEEFDEALGFAKKEEPKAEGQAAAGAAPADPNAPIDPNAAPTTPGQTPAVVDPNAPTPIDPTAPTSAMPQTPVAAPPMTAPADTTTPTMTDPTMPASPAPVAAAPAAVPPMTPDMNAPTSPAQPVMQTEVTPAPAAPNPLDGILKDLQTQMGTPAPAQTAAPQTSPTMPPAAPAPIAPAPPVAQQPPQPAAPAAPPTVPDFPKTQ